MENESHNNRLKQREEWDLILTSSNKWFDLNIADIWRYRDLLVLLVRRDLVAFYKQTLLGPLWYFVQPLLMTVVFTFLFGKLAGLSTNGLPQILFYLTGITAWSYFAECLTKTASVFRDNANLFGKVYFPRLIMPLSIVFSNMVRFSIQFSLLVCVFLYYHFQGFVFNTDWHILLFPILIFFMAAQGLGIGLFVSAMTIKYRDLALLVTFGVQLLMYGTAVAYPLSSVSGNLYLIIYYNPMTIIMEGIRFCLYGQGIFGAPERLYLFIVTFLILTIGIVSFNKVQKTFIDTI